MPTTTIILKSGRTVEVEYTVWAGDPNDRTAEDCVTDWWTIPKIDPLSPSEIDEVEAHFSSDDFELPTDQ